MFEKCVFVLYTWCIWEYCLYFQNEQYKTIYVKKAILGFINKMCTHVNTSVLL